MQGDSKVTAKSSLIGNISVIFKDIYLILSHMYERMLAKTWDLLIYSNNRHVN